MKKILLAAVLIMSVVLTMSCKTTSGTTTTSDPIDTQYANLYNRNAGINLTGARHHTVVSGDTLSGISRTYYDDGFYYPIIMLASHGTILNPDKIAVGMELTIPDLARNKADPHSRRIMKDCLNGYASIEAKKARPDQGLIKGFKERANEL